MPKVRRKRKAATTNRLARPLKSAPAPASTDQPTKAKFFDLNAKPNESVKSKATGDHLHLPKPPRNLKVADDWDVNVGDVLSWSEGRPTEAFFVTAEHKLLKNPDTSGSGYLTVPLVVTTQFSDAVNYYSSVLDAVGRDYVTSIELAPTDDFFVSHFSKQPLPEAITNRKDISFSFDPNEEILYVTRTSKPTESQHFPLNSAKTNDIIEWISGSDAAKAVLIVKFDYEGKETCSKVPRGVVSGLPSGWKCEQQGSLVIGQDKIQGEWKCQGPEKTQGNAKKAIEKFYKGFNVEIK